MMTTATKEEIAELAALTKAAKVGVLTTVDSSGHLVSRPMGMQEIEFDGDLWFFTQHPSPKTDDIAGNPEVNVSFESGKGWVSIAGTAQRSTNSGRRPSRPGFPRAAKTQHSRSSR
jgi:general stress protein 26